MEIPTLFLKSKRLIRPYSTLPYMVQCFRCRRNPTSQERPRQRLLLDTSNSTEVATSYLGSQASDLQCLVHLIAIYSSHFVLHNPLATTITALQIAPYYFPLAVITPAFPHSPPNTRESNTDSPLCPLLIQHTVATLLAPNRIALLQLHLRVAVSAEILREGPDLISGGVRAQPA